MGNYLNAELYKVSKRKYPYIFLLVMLGIILTLFIGVYSNGNPGEIDFYSMVSVLVMCLSVAIYLVIMPCDMAFSEQYKHNTLKNEVAYGIPRTRIYLGKLITSLMAAAVLCAILILVFLGLTLLMFTKDGIGEGMSMLGGALAMGLPTWIGSAGLFIMLSFLFKGATAATVTYVCIIGVLPSVLNMVGMLMPKLLKVTDAISACLLNAPYDTIFAQAQPNISYGWIVGMAWFVVTTAVGLIVFRKREIN